jgi:hypothetical protein
LASTVSNYSNLIDINFPVPGADNDLKKFSNNFSVITATINVAVVELAAIRNSGVYLTDNNVFSGTITNATVTNSTVVLKSYSSS